jgi:peptide/nickel transport system permease protein
MAAVAEHTPRETQAAGKAGLFARFKATLNLPSHDIYALVGLSIYAVFVLVALFGSYLATHDPTEILYLDDGNMRRNLPMSFEHLLGTNHGGNDIFSQLVLGTRTALIVGLAAAVVVAVIGTVVGLVSGYFGGWVDSVLMRLADVALGIPFLPFLILLAGFLGARSENVILGIALLLWPNTARVIRSQVLSVRERAFVEAARVTGASTWRILFVHVAPNILPLSFLYGSIAVGWAILTEAAISFLGFGPSGVVTWGTMLQDAYSSQALSRGQYNWFVPPGICIVLVVVAGFFISRGYEEILFPKLKD